MVELESQRSKIYLKPPNFHEHRPSTAAAAAGDRADTIPELVSSPMDSTISMFLLPAAVSVKLARYHHMASAYGLSALVETYPPGLQDLELRRQHPIMDLDSIYNHRAWCPYYDSRFFLSKFIPPLKSSIFILLLLIAKPGLSGLLAVLWTRLTFYKWWW
ncbi:hypothetical protein BHYA_0015g00210 [Botrytis hyacinthi]|uniref:Uncharacterized protein n=1 Tax=Botrytis hyacinthi TaxID=278943 RepID=A0A4Z1GZC0_9HELO|nr:hypothetical protein BHYA_0015g00210 [Botrytis hyacinthi]